MLMEETVWNAKIVHAIPKFKTSPISVVVIPVQHKARGGRRVQKELEPQVPREGEVTQSEGHGGGRKENGAAEEDRELKQRAQGSD
jgi:hypothetical protein